MYIMVSVPFLRNVPIFTLKYNYSQMCGILLSKLQALYLQIGDLAISSYTELTQETADK